MEKIKGFKMKKKIILKKIKTNTLIKKKKINHEKKGRIETKEENKTKNNDKRNYLFFSHFLSYYYPKKIFLPLQ